jgi:hypothetical protein
MRTSEALALALVAGCCAGHPNGEMVATTAAVAAVATGATGAAAGERPATEEFVVIDIEEATRRLWPRPGPTAYGPASGAEQRALGTLIGRMLTEDVAPSGLAGTRAAAGYVVEGWVLGRGARAGGARAAVTAAAAGRISCGSGRRRR